MEERLTATGRLAGRRSLITGAGGGLCSAAARAFAAEGSDVALIGRNKEKLERVAASMPGDNGRVEVVICDVADAQAARQAVDAVAGAFGGIDTIVNGAAIDTGWAPAGDMELTIWDDTIRINLNGTYYICRAGLPYLISAGGGTIVNITSVAGHKAWATDAAYNSSKAGVEILTRTIAVEYAGHGIRANCVAPGVIDAGLTDTVTDEAEREELVKLHPMARMGTVEEFAEAVVWLASDASSFTTGSTLRVDGGFLC
jgi:NAD(P)-dependent dehydrogenase (short-subunit alcohol dehydrogenase family)